MKTISGGLDTHLQGEVTSIARCWKITRVDGTQFFFTDHDQDLLVSGDTYKTMQGFSATAIATNATLDVDNLSVAGFFDDDSIKDADMAAGLFDYADVRVFIVNWADLTQGILKMRRGWLGEVIKSPSGYFSTELRGMTQPLQQTIGELYGPECRADLGDHRCKVPINPDVIQRITAYSVGDYGRVATAGGTGQEVYENRIYKCTTAGVTDSIAPTYDTVVGHSTTDGGGSSGTEAHYTPAGANFTVGQYVRIDDVQYTFVTTLAGSLAGYVVIGATRSDSMDNLFAAITLGAGSGTLYDATTPANSAITASIDGSKVITITLSNFSIPGQEVLLSELSNGAWDAAQLGTSSNGAVFLAQEAWTRSFVVATVTSRKLFHITVTDSRDVDDWFTGGAVVFDTGDNTGRAFEIRSWVQSGGIVTLFLPVGFTIQVGDKGQIYPGCDKRLVTCRDRFANLLNMRAEPYLPGADAAITYPSAH